MIVEHFLSRENADNVARSLSRYDEIAADVFMHKIVAAFRVFVPASTPESSLASHAYGGVTSARESTAPVVRWILREVEAMKRYAIIFVDYIRRVDDENDFLTRSGLECFEDERSVMYLYLTAEAISFDALSALIDNTGQYPRLGFIVESPQLEHDLPRKIKNEVVSRWARSAKTAFVGIYDEETIGIMSLESA